MSVSICSLFLLRAFLVYFFCFIYFDFKNFTHDTKSGPFEAAVADLARVRRHRLSRLVDGCSDIRPEPLTDAGYTGADTASSSSSNSHTAVHLKRILHCQLLNANLWWHTVSTLYTRIQLSRSAPQPVVNNFLPRDATQSAVLLWQVVCPSVCLSVRNVEVL